MAYHYVVHCAVAPWLRAKSSKESKAKKTKQKGKHKGDSSRDCSTTSQGAAADSTAATTQEKGQVAAAEEKGEEGEVVAVASLDQGAKKQCGLGGAVQLGALEALEVRVLFKTRGVPPCVHMLQAVQRW
eukprot:scaffold87540_cov18-Tisochrysis_lutea.AAC.1